jgi:glycosyltransferase involved in cell wall biosynthesis
MTTNHNYKFVFTVFTPTYNRASTLYRVYESLKQQTYHDFEWLIVDDGSIDNTSTLIEQWKKEAKFPIRYIWQKNQGKHIAFNYGVQEAKGELFLTLDSDDACLPEALERFQHHWNSIPVTQRSKFAGVTVLCLNQKGKVVGTEFPFYVTDSNSIEIHAKYGVIGEKWGFQKTDILKMFPFPEIPDENFITEAIVWHRISKKYKTRFVNEKLRIYYEDTSNSLTNSSIKCRVKNSKSARLYYQEYSSLNLPYIWKYRGVINYIRFSFHAGVNIIDIIKDSQNQDLTTILLVVGFLFYYLDCFKLSRTT